MTFWLNMQAGGGVLSPCKPATSRQIKQYLTRKFQHWNNFPFLSWALLCIKGTSVKEVHLLKMLITKRFIALCQTQISISI